MANNQYAHSWEDFTGGQNNGGVRVGGIQSIFQILFKLDCFLTRSSPQDPYGVFFKIRNWSPPHTYWIIILGAQSKHVYFYKTPWVALLYTLIKDQGPEAIPSFYNQNDAPRSTQGTERWLSKPRLEPESPGYYLYPTHLRMKLSLDYNGQHTQIMQTQIQW